MEKLEKVLKCREVATEMNISYGKARLLIKDEPGVLRFTSGQPPRTIYRVPQSVLERMIRVRSNPPTTTA